MRCQVPELCRVAHTDNPTARSPTSETPPAARRVRFPNCAGLPTQIIQLLGAQRPRHHLLPEKSGSRTVQGAYVPTRRGRLLGAQPSRPHLLHENSCSQTCAGFADTHLEGPAAWVPTAGAITPLHAGLLRIGIRLPREQQRVLRKGVHQMLRRRSLKATNNK